jgi:hypothetical protein
MDIKNIKLMLLGIAIMIFGVGVCVIAVVGFGFWGFQTLMWEYTEGPVDWIEAVFASLNAIMTLVAYIFPLAGFIVTVVGFFKKYEATEAEVEVEVIEEESDSED